MKKHNFLKYAAALCLFAVCLLSPSVKADADYVYDAKNGVSYTDKAYISSGYAGHYSYGGGGYINVQLSVKTDRVKNVKSKSKNLLAKKTLEVFNFNTTSTKNNNTGKYEYTETKEYSSAVISFFGKKKGTYKVTFDVVDANGKKKCTKTVKVYVDKYNTTVSKPAIKSMTYAGTDFWQHAPFTKKTSGKFKVKMNKGYSLVSIYVKKQNTKGEWVSKKVKNGKKITLAKTQKFSYSYTGSHTNYDYLFPETQIEVTYKDKKTKTNVTQVYTLRTLNKK